METRGGSPPETKRSELDRGRDARADRPILLAEDDEPMRVMLASLLRADGYEVNESANGVELLESVADAVARGGRRKPAVSLVITDVRMPGLSGLDVLTILRTSYWATPVIVLTGFADRIVRNEAIELGVTKIFDKPIDIDELLAAVHRAAPRSRAESSLALWPGFTGDASLPPASKPNKGSIT